MIIKITYIFKKVVQKNVFEMKLCLCKKSTGRYISIINIISDFHLEFISVLFDGEL
jgi:hypothetical protein